MWSHSIVFCLFFIIHKCPRPHLLQYTPELERKTNCNVVTIPCLIFIFFIIHKCSRPYLLQYTPELERKTNCNVVILPCFLIIHKCSRPHLFQYTPELERKTQCTVIIPPADPVVWLPVAVSTDSAVPTLVSGSPHHES